MKTTLDSISVRYLDEELPLSNLERAILGAGVQVLDPDDVQRYQGDMRAAARAAGVWTELACAWRRAVIILVWAICLLLPAALVWTGMRYWMVALVSLIAILAVSKVNAVLSRPRGRRRPVGYIDWRTYSAGQCQSAPVPMGDGHFQKAADYYGSHSPLLRQFSAAGTRTVTQIPEEAREIARKIAAQGVDAEFRVEQLDDDPFLFVKVGYERFYLFAWDEEGFIPR